jgi:hypothetical protein
MQVKIKNDPVAVLFKNQQEAKFASKAKIKKLESIKGTTIEIDITKLKSKEFVLKDGTVIPDIFVEEIIGDVRKDFKLCSDCGTSIYKVDSVCSHCFGTDFLNIFTFLPEVING